MRLLFRGGSGYELRLGVGFTRRDFIRRVSLIEDLARAYRASNDVRARGVFNEEMCDRGVGLTVVALRNKDLEQNISIPRKGHDRVRRTGYIYMEVRLTILGTYLLDTV